MPTAGCSNTRPGRGVSTTGIIYSGFRLPRGPIRSFPRNQIPRSGAAALIHASVINWCPAMVGCTPSADQCACGARLKASLKISCSGRCTASNSLTRRATTAWPHSGRSRPRTGRLQRCKAEWCPRGSKAHRPRSRGICFSCPSASPPKRRCGRRCCRR